jgi:hypothetical protein
MFHHSNLWKSPTHQLAEQYRLLADWIEKYDTLPWHIGVNWSKDALLIHLKQESFSRIFQGHITHQSVDTLGITWTIESEGLIFTCFIPCSQVDQQVQIPSTKESA